MTLPSPPRPNDNWLTVGVCALAIIVVGVVLTHYWPWQKGGPERPPAAAAPVARPKPEFPEKPPETSYRWTESTPLLRTTYSSSGLTISLSARGLPGFRAAVAEVKAPDGSSASIAGDPVAAVAAAEILTGRLDPSSALAQVIVVTPAQCAQACAKVQVLDSLPGGWRVLEVGFTDSAGLGAFPSDVDGDGVREIALEDIRFNAAFAPAGASVAVPVLKTVAAGRVADVSSAARFRPTYEAFLTRTRQACQARQNGACPAFVAVAARLGRADWAWSIMLRSYDGSSNWSLPSACRLVEAKEACPPADQVKFASYPEALRWFLGDLGYLSPVYIPQRGDTGPSFDCSKIRAQTLQLVCASPDLSMADRDLAFLYWRALARSDSPAELIESERNFIRARNNAVAEVGVLLGYYQRQLAILRAAAGDPPG